MFEKVLPLTKTFFTSDTHFNHYRIAKYCDRPYESKEEMNNTLIENWNNVVPEDGIVVHCGDFALTEGKSFKDYEKIAKKLNGRIILIRGNHDRVPVIIEDNPDSKFIAVVDMAKLTINNSSFIASHFPLLAYPSDYNIFGHVHTLKDGLCHGLDSDINHRLRPTQYDVGVDQNGYKPLTFKELQTIFNERVTYELGVRTSF